MAKYVNLGPVGWQKALPIYLACIENGSAKGRQMALEDLRKMARLADQAVLDQYLADNKAMEEAGDMGNAKEMAERAVAYAKAAGLKIPGRCDCGKPAAPGFNDCLDCAVEVVEAIEKGEY